MKEEIYFDNEYTYRTLQLMRMWNVFGVEPGGTAADLADREIVTTKAEESIDGEYLRETKTYAIT